MFPLRKSLIARRYKDKHLRENYMTDLLRGNDEAFMMLVVENKFPKWYQTAEEMQKVRDMGVKYKKNNENKEGDSLTSDKNLAK